LQNSDDNSSIYKDDEDKSRVVAELHNLTKKSHVSILCYCVMGSNLNLILSGKEVAITNLMGKLFVAYVSYFLYKYIKTGDTYKTTQKLIRIKDRHDFMQTMSFIHHIPVYKGANS